MIKEIEKIRKITGTIKNIYTEQIALKESFIDFAARFASIAGTAVLMSGGKFDSSRFHILATKPWLTLSGRGHNLNVSCADKTLIIKANPFDALKKIVATFEKDLSDCSVNLPLPVKAGLFGYLSYDLKDCLEDLPRTSMDDLTLPHLFLFAPSIIVVHDKTKDKTCLCITERTITAQGNSENILDFFNNIVNAEPSIKAIFPGSLNGFKSSTTKNKYKNAVKKIKEYISSGHVYQVNFSQRFEADFNDDPFHLYKTLYSQNPAPFFAFIHAESHWIISTSPERLIKRDLEIVETRPIKGTRPRGSTPALDKDLQKELLISKKDDAELSMIVDLLRNDLGKVCQGGTVKVEDHKRLESYKNVFHLLSVIKGLLKKGYDSIDVITAVFPGGSITGCPKIRSMEIIDELETKRRHIYTGSIGYISFHNTMDLSIAIRTAIIYSNKIFFSVGGGVVYDSDPQDEFEESLHKGKTLMNIFNNKNNKSSAPKMIWVNGNMEVHRNASIPITDQGFLYGFGFFETIRTDNGKPLYLAEHIERFYKTWKKLFESPVPDLTWDVIIDQVLNANGLHTKTAAVKILATRGSRNQKPFDHTLIVTAKPYAHRLAGTKKTGFNIAVYPESRQTPLANHKTLNYLYYLLAGQWAKKNGADEALILNPDGTVSETNTANIILMKDKSIIIPDSSSVLPGVMQQVLCCCFKRQGYRIKHKSVVPEDLFSAEQVLVTNSLLGVVPVYRLNGKKLINNDIELKKFLTEFNFKSIEHESN